VAPPTDSAQAGPPADSAQMAAAAAWMDSLRAANPLRRTPPREATPASTAASASAGAESVRSTTPRTTRDSIPQRVITSVTDSIFNFRGATPRGDTTRRDTLRPVRQKPRQ